MTTHAAPAKPNDTVGAFVSHGPAPMRGAETGPLARRTFAVKDLYDMAGFVTGGGSPDWLRTHAPAAATAPTVQKALDAGADFVGKTVSDEFFYSVSGDNAHYGTPKNVRAPGRLPGGSSSGSAAAVAAGLADFALGSDTGGSVRMPASFCGLYGIRPTHGRVDLTGGMPMAQSFDTGGWFADDADLFRAVGGVLLDATGVPAPIERVMMAEDCFAEADAPVSAALHEFLKRAADVLPEISYGRVAPAGFDAWRETLRIHQAWEVWQNYGAWITANNPSFGPGIRERMEMARGITKAQYDTSRQERAAVIAHAGALIPPGTVVCLPTAPCIAPPLDMSAAELDSFRRRAMALSCTGSLSGHPQVSIPAVVVDFCPAGISFLGWRGGDEALLDLAAALAGFCGRAG